MTQKSMTRTDWLQVICVTYLCVWSTSPPLLSNNGARAVALLALFVWFCVEIFRHPESFIRPTVLLAATVSFLVYSNAVSFAVDKTEGLKWLIPADICILFLVIYECHRRRGIHMLRPVFWTVLSLNLVWSLVTIVRMTSQRNVARIVTRSSEEALQLQAEGVGGFALVYFALILVPICVYLLRHRVASNRISAAVLWVTLVFSVILILKGGYAIATIILVISVPFSLLLDRPTPNSFLRTGALIAFTVPMLFLAAPIAMDYLTDVTRGTMYERKVRDIVFSVQNSDSVGTVNDRTNRYARTFEAIKSNPVIGVLSRNNVGKHSAILDRIAEYGMVFGGTFIYLLSAIPVRNMLRKGSLSFGLSVTVGLVALIFASLNNVFPAYGVALFILFPIAVDFVEERTSVPQPAEPRPVPIPATPQAT